MTKNKSHQMQYYTVVYRPYLGHTEN